MWFIRQIGLLLLSLAFAQFLLAAQKQSAYATPVIQLEISGPIGPATADYISRNLDLAAERGAECVLLRIDTPGGLDISMRHIIKKIIASPIPVISYVAPSGARAASAGTYIVYASHIAAMAPATNLGAATPVQLLGSTPMPDSEKDNEKRQRRGKDISNNPMAHKMINDAVAYIRGLATMRGRNADWAEKAVREAASLPAQEALKLQVIDLIAVDEKDLLEQLHGWKLHIFDQEIVLQTRDAPVQIIKPDWRSELLSVIANPNVAYILLLIGAYGLIFEFSNPGTVLPGITGGICLLLALYAFQVLPVNYAGMALIILGIALMVTEAFIPSFGALGVGGIIAFVIGSVILIDTDVPGFGINKGLIGGFALASAAFFILALGLLVKSRYKPVVTGKEEMIGQHGVVLDDFKTVGRVRVHSENWQALSKQALRKNDKVRVDGLDGLTLLVSPLTKKEQE